MENPNTIISSTRTDYGSTTHANTFISDTLNSDSLTIVTAAVKTTASVSQRFSTRSTESNRRGSRVSAVGGYQSLPNTSTGNLHNNRSSRHFKMSMDTMPNSETRQIVQRLEFLFSVINQICIGFVTIFMSWLCLRTGLAGTALHAWLVTIGYSFLMAEGIMSHFSGNVLTFNYKRTTKTTIHWTLQALGGSLGVAGTLIKLIQKGFTIYSTHAKLGFAAMILCAISMCSGLIALFSMRLKRTLNPLLNKSFHNLVGVAAFAVALVAQYYGYQTGFFSRKVDTDFQILMKVITLLSLVLTSIGPLQALYHKCINIYRHFS
ncbi:cytochrome b561 domain-containing protein 2-like [Teleopsis dalmanni]|uniref:cytochrome b561 domain-containing protein 2-like n=1 Tax=Teleopsis dalmanni TaxID=139649 RepID=UPI0018CFACE0|nr:cytochrome b561 domain-containing protein 2-like [Teleopsis dalmanni]